MPSINMITVRREEKRRHGQYARKLIYAIVAEIGIVILVASFMTVKIFTIRGHIDELNRQIARLQTKVDQIQSMEDSTMKLKPTLATVNEARNTTLYWYTALQTVTASLPQSAYLTSIGTSGDPSPTAANAALAFNGVAGSGDQVGQAMMQMNQFQNISAVTLGGLQQTSAAGGNMSFQMQVALKPNTAGDATPPSAAVQSVPTPSAAPSMQSTNQARLIAPITSPTMPAAVKQASLPVEKGAVDVNKS